MRIREKIYNFLKKNENSCYEYYQGTNNLWNKFCWNCFFPGRILDRIYGNTVGNRNYKQDFYVENKNYNFKKFFEDFHENGCIVIKNYFDNEKINLFLNDYKEVIIKAKKTLKENSEKKQFTEYLKLKNSLMDILLDDNLIALLKNFTDGQIYARDYPVINFHGNWDNLISTKEKCKGKVSTFADDWHVDHANIINVHVILEDLSENDLCMEFIPKSNQNFNLSYLYSDESVEKIKPFQIDKCTGMSGTVYIHYGNTLHRLRPVKNSKRLLFKGEFTSKTNILLNSSKIANSLSDGFNIEKLENKKKEILKGLYPINTGKGYTIINNDIVQTRSKSI